MGTAMVTPDHVRLTPDLQSRQGAVWSRIVSLLQQTLTSQPQSEMVRKVQAHLMIERFSVM